MWGFEMQFSKPFTYISCLRREVPTPSVVEGQSAIILKPRILKHHIPELPIEAYTTAASRSMAASGASVLRPDGYRVFLLQAALEGVWYFSRKQFYNVFEF